MLHSDSVLDTLLSLLSIFTADYCLSFFYLLNIGCGLFVKSNPFKVQNVL